MTDKVWLITGCSSGFGRALAEAALSRGDRVVVTARNIATIADFATRWPAASHLATLDVKSLQKILREVEAARLAIALSAANENLRQTLLGALSKRAAETVNDEISNLGKTSLREIEQAQEGIVDVVRKLESDGEISLDSA